MKAIINGKRFDTEKAVLVGKASSGLMRSDFGWWEARLYRTPRTKTYFLAGEGGPKTRWARRYGDMWGNGEGISPLSPEEAREWAERYLDVDVIEQEFGSMIEDA